VRNYLRFAIAVLIMTGAACSHHHGATAGPQPARLPVTVNVTNNYETSIEVFAVGAGTSYHIGSVAPGIVRSFELSMNLIGSGGSVRFLAQVTGYGPRVQTDDVVLSPGDVVDFEITTNFFDSRATVRP
jgi:hypothetical protein